MTRSGALLSTMLVAAVGCSGGAATPSQSRTVDATSATVTFQAGFPQALAKNVVDWSGTSAIVVTAENGAGASWDCVLSPDTPSCTMTLPIGRYVFAAERFDLALESAEIAGSAGTLVPGENTVVLTFLDGEWTLAQPILLSNGAELLGFRLAYDVGQPRPGPEALEADVPRLATRYVLTYLFDTGEGIARIRHYTRFDGGVLNGSAFDGGGYSLTNGCGEPDGGTYDGSCPTDGGPAGDTAESWIRILGDTGGVDRCSDDCGPGNREVWRLLPETTFDQDVSGIANATAVDGTTIEGTLIEYQFAAYQAQVMEVLAPFVPPPPTAGPGANEPFDLAVSEYSPVVVCRDGLDGSDPDATVWTGSWDFTGCAQGADVNGDMYFECGRLAQGADPGECSWGLELADLDAGEWCDGTWDPGTRQCDRSTADGMAQPDELVDMDGDGRIDPGSLFVGRFLEESFDVHGASYSFTATGVPAVQVAALASR